MQKIGFVPKRQKITAFRIAKCAEILYNIKCMNSVRCRIKRGMDIKTALTKPMQKKVKDMTPEELEERKIKRLEKDRKWREEHKEQVRKSREKWIKNNPDKNKESKRKYEEKIKKLKQI